MFNKPLIITLIRAELRNKILTSGLEYLGFDCSYFIFDLSKEVLLLIGYFNCPENIFEIYFKLIEQAVSEIKMKNFNEMLEIWSEMIYNNLEEGYKNANLN